MSAQTQETDGVDRGPALVLRLGDPKEPKTPKGFRTQAKIMVAGRAVMARHGFLNSRIQDVATEAGCALGTVYTYFDDKADLLAALLEEIFPEMMEVSRRSLHRGDAATVLYGIIYDYLAVYRRHRDLFELLAEATAIDERFRAYWFTVRGEFVVTMVRGFETAKKSGELNLPGDPVLWASAIGGLVHNFATVWFGVGGERHDGIPFRDDVSLEESAELLTRITLRSLFLEDLPPGFTPPPPSDGAGNETPSSPKPKAARAPKPAARSRKRAR
jgi:AcrR family transcriptional regulator